MLTSSPHPILHTAQIDDGRRITSAITATYATASIVAFKLAFAALDVAGVLMVATALIRHGLVFRAVRLIRELDSGTRCLASIRIF
jgi:hypothetical protein